MKIGLISDIHENAESLVLVLKELEKKKCDEVVCLGDILGFDNRYYDYHEKRDPSECLRLVRESCRTALIGNHDLYVLKKIPEYRSGFDYPHDWYDLMPVQRIMMSGRRIWKFDEGEECVDLNDMEKQYLSGLPEYIIKDYDGVRLMFSHSAYPDLSGCTTKIPYLSVHLWAHLQFMKKNGCSLGISGHLHPPGLLNVTRFRFRVNGSKALKIGNNPQWISCPNVSGKRFENGFAILDTGIREITSYFVIN